MTKHGKNIIAVLLATLALFAPALPAHADIFQWEYINPAVPNQGKQPSAILCPEGAGANAAPGANLSNRNLTKAYLIGANLSTYLDLVYDGFTTYVSEYHAANLTAANLSQADLSNANFQGAWWDF